MLMVVDEKSNKMATAVANK